jgi:hypothetical protein
MLGSSHNLWVRIALASILSASIGYHVFPQEPKPPTTCRVQNVGTPCYTIRSKTWMVDKVGSGWFDVSAKVIEEVEALREDGSHSETVVSEDGNVTRLTLHPFDHSNRELFAIDHKDKVVYPQKGFMGGVPYWEADDQLCTHATEHFTSSPSGRLSDTVIAGLPAVGYYWKFEGGESEQYYGPTVDCVDLQRRVIERNSLGVPTSFYLRTVESLTLGPPDPRFFAIPSDYQQITIPMPKRQ